MEGLAESNEMRDEEIKYQHIDKFTLYLDGVCQTKSHSIASLEIIKYYLKSAVVNRDISKISFWISSLQRFVNNNGLMLTKQDHLLFITLLYSLMTENNLEDKDLIDCSRCYNCFFKKEHLIVPQQDLTLEWKPLYDLCKQRVFKHKFQFIEHDHSLADTMKLTVMLSKIYFSLSSTKEIFELECTSLCPFSYDMVRGMLKLSWFLPVTTKQNNTHEYYIWLPKLMEIWQTCPNSHWEEDLFDLISCLASTNVGLINWDPYLDFIYGRILNSFPLPIHFEGSEVQSPTGNIKSKAAAKWIVYSLGGDSKSQKYLTNLLNSLGTLFLPVNKGNWSRELNNFHTALVFTYYDRIKSEKLNKPHWKAVTPLNAFITENEKEEFVKSVLIETSETPERQASKYQLLAQLQPKLIVDFVLEKFHSALNDTTNSKDLKLSLVLIFSICDVLVNGNDYGYPEARTYVIPLLKNLISTLNVINRYNTASVFTSIGLILSQIPFGVHEQTTDSEIEVNIVQDSSYFEEIAIQIFNYVVKLINSLTYVETRPDSNKTDHRMDQFSTLAMTKSICRIFKNVSDDIFKTLLNKLTNLVFETTMEIEVSGHFLACLCKTFAILKPDLTLRSLMPRLLEQFLSMVDEDGEMVGDATEHDALYYLKIISKTIKCDSFKIIDYMPDLVGVLDRGPKLEDRRGEELSSDILKVCLSKLSSTFLRVQYDYKYTTEYWGLKVTPGAVKTFLETPGENEINTVHMLMDRYIIKSMSSIKAYVENDDVEYTRLEDESSNLEIQKYHDLSLIRSNYIFEPFQAPMQEFFRKTMKKLQEKLLNVQEEASVLKTLLKAYEEILITELTNLPDYMKSAILQPSELSYITEIIRNFKYLNKKKGTYSFLYYETEILRKYYDHNHLVRGVMTDTMAAMISTLTSISISSNNKENYSLAIVFITGIAKFNKNVLKIVLPLLNQYLNSSSDKRIRACLELMVCNLGGNAKLYLKNAEVLKSIINAMATAEQDKADEWLFSNLIKIASTSSLVSFWHEEIAESTVEICKKINSNTVLGSPLKNVNVINQKELFEQQLNTILSMGHWRQDMVILSFLQNYILPDVDLPAKFFDYLFEKLTNHSATVRTYAMKVCCVAFHHVHHKYWLVKDKEVIDVQNFFTIPQNWNFGEDANTDRIQFQIETMPDTFENALICHNNNTGYSSWPRNIKRYKYDEVVTSNSQMCDFFNEENVTMLCNLKVLIEVEGSRLDLDEIKFYLNCESSMYIFLKVLPSFVNTDEAANHQMASHIVAASFETVKYWPSSKQEKIMDAAISVFDIALKDLTKKTLSYWTKCLSYITAYRDPNTVQRLYYYFNRWSVSIDGGLLTADLNRSMILLSNIMDKGWRLASFNNLMYQKVINDVKHPMENIRSGVARILHFIMEPDIEIEGQRTTRSPKVADFINEIMPNLICLDPNNQGTSTEDRIIQKKEAQAILETVSRIIYLAANKASSINPNIYRVIPYVCILDELETTTKEFTRCLRDLSTYCPRKTVFVQLFDDMCSYFTFLETDNKGTIALLKYTRNFIFFNLPSLYFDVENINKINAIVIKLLQHKNIEIRLRAKDILSDFIHHSVSLEIQVLMDKFGAYLKEPYIRGNIDSVIKRQAGVLGLLALVQGNPYSVPDYLEGVFQLLTQYQNDPSPINKWISEIIAGFKNKHIGCEFKNAKIVELISTFHPPLSYIS